MAEIIDSGVLGDQYDKMKQEIQNLKSSHQELTKAVRLAEKT
eukprot:CAMPEP_0116897696 /NCGR_PEP_ID=MMETSP0467-20121206/6612_1 /TAXON_ID=283647 /ORGANISM="Mesodinium pulex, Strain SPMC105" /LENGTH=41 /DNA_ID= /DNA_START= /DNA_END= /DNA_ORIENTATION=